MLKWNAAPEEEPIRIPGFFTWLAVSFYGGALFYVLYLWYRLGTIILQHNQSILVWLKP